MKNNYFLVCIITLYEKTSPININAKNGWKLNHWIALVTVKPWKVKSKNKIEIKSVIM